MRRRRWNAPPHDAESKDLPMQAQRFTRIILASALLIAACGGGSDNGPEQSLKALLEQIITGQGERAWDTMYPAQQAIVTREQYARCVKGLGVELDRFDIRESYEDTITVPGTDVTAETMTLVYRIELRQGDDKGTLTDTAHVIEVDGEWRWVLNDPEPFIEGRCP